MTPTRETIAVALFGILNTVAMKSTFKTISRRPRVWDEAIEMPALYLAQPDEEKTYNEGTVTPGVTDILFDVIIYTNSGLDPNVVPDTEMNSCIEAIETALAVGITPGQPQTLGGIVHHARIEGTINRAPGYLDGRGAAFFNIRVLLPS